MSWGTAKLREIATIEREQIDPRMLNSRVQYLGLEDIEAGGQILESHFVERGELASTKFTFTRDHVLYGKLRPYLAKVSLPDFEGICSTDILPIMPGPRLDRRFLAYFLRQPEIVEYAKLRSTGANLPRLSPKALADFDIPFPDLKDQRRIASILDKADSIRLNRSKIVGISRDFLKSSYIHLVGYKHPNHAKWTPHRVEELVKDRKRDIRTGPFGSALRHGEFVDHGIAVLGIDNAVKNHFEWGERRFITAEKYAEMRRYRAFPGDVIITIMGTTGRSAVVPSEIPEAITTKHLATITCDDRKAVPEFLSFAIHSDPLVIRQIHQANKGAIMDGLNLSIIRNLEINLPPLSAQIEFAQLLKTTRRITEESGSKLGSGTELFTALARRAFRGEL